MSARVTSVRGASILLLAMAALALISLSARFNYARLGIFPHDARAAMWPCCGGVQTELAAQLGSVPLAASPLVARAGQIGKSGRNAARTLMAEAVRRDPQSGAARSWLAMDSAVHGDFDDSVRQLDWLYAIDNQARPKVVKALASLATFRESRGAVERFAARRPDWLGGVADQLVGDNADPAIVFRLIGGARTDSGSVAEASRHDAGVIQSLLRRKQYDLAYLAWVSQLPTDTVSRVGYVYDSRFERLPGGAPFNWSSSEGGGATVDFLKGGGLDVSYYGDAPAAFVSQMLMLPPGTYRLTAVAGRAGKADGNLAGWSLACTEAPGTPLMTLDVPFGEAPKAAAATFTIGAMCETQVLTLGGRPSDYPSTIHVNVRSVAIAANGGGQ